MKRNANDYVNCIHSSAGGGYETMWILIIEVYMAKIYRIRKLTPTECMRLMGVYDYDTRKMREAGISDSQLYKMAGNSIVVDVLEGIFTQLLRKDSESLF